jgi:hypothetical protein
MAKTSFYNFMSAYHPEFRLKRVMEDACDTCYELREMLKDKSKSVEELNSIEEALTNHGEMARTMRRTHAKRYCIVEGKQCFS